MHGCFRESAAELSRDFVTLSNMQSRLKDHVLKVVYSFRGNEKTPPAPQLRSLDAKCCQEFCKVRNMPIYASFKLYKPRTTIDNYLANGRVNVRKTQNLRAGRSG